MTPSEKENQVRKVVALIIVGAVVCWLLFAGYAFMMYGGVRNFRLEHQKFPGAHSAALESSRKKALDDVAAINKVAVSLSAKPVYASPLTQNIDVCVKGEHKPPGPAATSDSYAYWCTLGTEQFYAFNEPRCDVVTLLLQAKDTLQGDACDATKDSDGMRGNGTDVLISVYARDTYVRQHAVSALPNTCDTGRRTVYCSNTGKSVDITKVIPASAQTIVVVSSGSSYYLK